MRRFLFALLLVSAARGQVLQLTGGDSSLYGAAGAGVTAYFPNQTAYLGAGFAQGHFAFGVSDTFQSHGYEITAGDKAFSFSFDGAGAGLQTRGLSIQRTNADESIGAFVGSAGLGNSLPYYNATTGQHIGAGIYGSRKVGCLRLSGLSMLNGGQHTALAGVGYTGQRLTISGSAGLLISQTFWNGQAAYRFRHVNLSAFRENLYWNSQTAIVNSLAVGVVAGAFNASANLMQGESMGRAVTGQSLNVSTHFGPVSATASWYVSNHQFFQTQSGRETFRHWSLSQSVSEMAGRSPSFTAGGAYKNNHFAVSLDHSVQFLPFGSQGFQQVTTVTFSLRIPHTQAALNLGAAMLPTGGPRYTISGSDYAKGPWNGSSAGPTTHGHSSTGKLTITGRVLDKAGQPVQGAAVAIGRDVVFTNSSGRFLLRTKKATAVPLMVQPEQFATPGNWRVVSAPTQVQPGAEICVVVNQN